MQKGNPDYVKGITFANEWLGKADLPDIRKVAEPDVTSTITGLPSPFKVESVADKSLEFKKGFVKRVKEQYKQVKKSL